MNYYGTIGPSCESVESLENLFTAGMTGIRINLSHKSLSQCANYIENVHKAEKNCNMKAEILIDLQGPELRIGVLQNPIHLKKDEIINLGSGGIPIPEIIIPYLKKGQDILLDDSLILLKVFDITKDQIKCTILRGGVLSSRKSIALVNLDIPTPTLTDEDYINISEINRYGVTGIMLPFVRNRDDLLTLKDALNKAGAGSTKVFAKIENQKGVALLDTFMELADEIIIARGDLGNSMPLWELPKAQKNISSLCLKNNKPFMVVTQLLHSMTSTAIPTRAEVSDIFNAVLDGASSLMLTGETAIGAYPVAAMRYLVNTAEEGLQYKRAIEK